MKALLSPLKKLICGEDYCEIQQPLPLERLGIQIGREETDSCTMNIKVQQNKDVLALMDNCHGKKDRWIIRIFIPTDIYKTNLVKKVRLELTLGAKRKDVIHCDLMKSAVDDNSTESFSVLKFIYVNPYKTGPKPHQLRLTYDKEEHFLFDVNIFMRKSLFEVDIPSFWEVLIVGTKLIESRQKEKTSLEFPEAVFLAWSAIFKCYHTSELDHLLMDLYRNQNRLNDFIQTCYKIIDKDCEEVRRKYMVECPIFGILYLLMDNSERDLFVSNIRPFVKFFNYGASENDTLPKIIDVFSANVSFTKEETDKMLDLVQKRGMGEISKMACCKPGQHNLILFQLMDGLLQSKFSTSLYQNR